MALPACPACRFIQRRCPAECLLSPHFPPETEAALTHALETVPLQSVTIWLLTRVPIPDRPARAAEAVAVASQLDGSGFTQQARELLVEALLSEVAERDAEDYHFRGPNGLPIVDSYLADFFCCVSDLTPLLDQLELRDVLIDESFQDTPPLDDH